MNGGIFTQTNQRRLRTAIIGCGGIAQVHQKVLTSLPEAELVACCDIKPERAQQMAEACGIRAYTDACTLLETERPEVVHLCVPHPLHTPLAKLAASYGASVFTEKPPVVSMEQWETLEALEKSGVRIGVCFQNRYNAAVQAMRELLKGEKTGAILGARAFVTWHRTPAYYQSSDWRGRWDTEGGGELINQSIHTLDLLVYLLGKPVEAEATMRNHSLRGVIEVEDTVEAYIRFQAGCSAVYYATNAYCKDEDVMVEVVSAHARLRMEGQKLTIFWDDGRVEEPSFAQPESLGKGYWGNGHYECIRDFYCALLENRSYRNDVASTRDTMHLMLDLYRPYQGTLIQ